MQLAKLAGGVAVAGAGMVTFGKGVELGISLIQNWRAAVVLRGNRNWCLGGQRVV